MSNDDNIDFKRDILPKFIKYSFGPGNFGPRKKVSEPVQEPLYKNEPFDVVKGCFVPQYIPGGCSINLDVVRSVKLDDGPTLNKIKK